MCTSLQLFICIWLGDRWRVVVVLGGRGGGLLTMVRPFSVEEPCTTPYHLNKSIGCERLVLSAVLSRIPGTNTGHFSRAMKSTSFREVVSRNVTEYSTVLLQSPSHHKRYCFFKYCIFVLYFSDRAFSFNP
jgi:hypothetical protein